MDKVNCNNCVHREQYGHCAKNFETARGSDGQFVNDTDDVYDCQDFLMDDFMEFEDEDSYAAGYS
jgi:hypothetical protein